MTEYDYSPAAYERHLSNQNRVSNWVSSQSSHTQEYRNPFVPSAYQPPKPLPPERDSRPSTKASSRSRSSTVTSPSPTSPTPTPARHAPVRSQTEFRPQNDPRRVPVRSQTLPPHQSAPLHPSYAVVPGASQPIVLSSPRDQHRSSHHSSRSPSKSSRHRHHHSSSATNGHNVQIPHDRDSSGRRVIHLEPDKHSGVVHLPAPRQGEQYVIIPPPGGKVQIVNPHNHRVEYRQEKETTLLKRIFGSFAGPGRGSDSRSRPQSRSHSRRRSY